MTTPFQPSITARLVEGYRVASGFDGDARFPGGTLRTQLPHFLARGLDLGAFHLEVPEPQMVFEPTARQAQMSHASTTQGTQPLP